MKKIKALIGCVLLLVGCLMVLYGSFNRPYKDLVEQYAGYYGVDTRLIYAIMKAESKHDANAISRSGAKGLMQIMDRTGAWGAEEIGLEQTGSEKLLKPEVNLQIGCWYVARLLKQYEGDLS